MTCGTRIFGFKNKEAKRVHTPAVTHPDDWPAMLQLQDIRTFDVSGRLGNKDSHFIDRVFLFFEMRLFVRPSPP